MRSKIIVKAAKLFVCAIMTYIVVSLFASIHSRKPKIRVSDLPPHILYQRFHPRPMFPPNATSIEVAFMPFLIPNRELCKDANAIQHVVVVHSAVSNFERRRSFRETWANPNALPDLETRTVFIVGKSRDRDVQVRLQDESNIYKDIVQGDFFDDYTNLTRKAVTGLKWVTENCPNSEVVMKVDDDVFVDIFKGVNEIFPLARKNPKQLICSVEPRAIIFRKGDTEKVNKWKIPDEYFPRLEKYPMPFCYGFGVIYSTDLAGKLFSLSKSTPFYRLDDVYVYGILANKIPGLIWLNEYTLFSQDANLTMDIFRQKSKEKPLLLGTARSASAMQELWDLTRKLHSTDNRDLFVKLS